MIENIFITNDVIKSNTFFEMINNNIFNKKNYIINLSNLKLKSMNFSKDTSKCFAVFKNDNGINIKVSINNVI
jgi:hypothetical protein